MIAAGFGVAATRRSCTSTVQTGSKANGRRTASISFLFGILLTSRDNADQFYSTRISKSAFYDNSQEFERKKFALLREPQSQQSYL
jgi:hypothetical protein